MIQNINKLNNVRSFLNFDGSSVTLGNKNIIYAPNGTGKTNLTRLIDKASKNEPLDDFCSQEANSIDEFDFELNISGERISKSNLKDKFIELDNISVFNIDYIEKTIKCKDFTQTDVSGDIVIPLGSVSNVLVELQSRIDELTKSRGSSILKIQENHPIYKDNILKKQTYSLSDRNIWTAFSINNIIDKENFKVFIPENLESFEECEKSFTKLNSIPEDYSIELSKEITIIEYDFNFNSILSELNSTKEFSPFDEKTKEDIKFITENWISQKNLTDGIKLSRSANECKLCKRELDSSVDDLFTKYEVYFENEESKYKNTLEDYRVKLETLIVKIEKFNNDLKLEVNEYTKLFSIEDSWVDFEISNLKQKLKELQEKVETKKSKPSARVILDNTLVNFNFSSEIKQLNLFLDNNLKLVAKINSKISSSTSKKAELRTIIGNKFLYEFYIENKETFTVLMDSINEIKAVKRQIAEEQEKLPSNTVSINVKKITNKLLNNFISLKKYKINEKEGIIFIELNDMDISKATHKLSDGEKTMISLCFFLASSIKKYNSSDKFFNSVFIIDDPVSSTSYNYFFGICNLIKHFQEVIVDEVWSSEKNKLTRAKIQKIILTHNTQFFNVLSVNVFKKRAKYFVLSQKNIKEIPGNHLKSEFENSLVNIKLAIKDSEPKPIGNDIRRFFETIRHFYGYSEFNAESLNLIFTEFDEYRHQVFFNVINYYSHGNPESHTDPLPVNFNQFLLEFEDLIVNSQFKELWNKIEIE